MTTIELARELGKAIQADERYTEYAAAQKANDEDKELQDLIGEFNLIRQNLSLEMSKDEAEKSDEKIKEYNEKMQKTYTLVMTNENMANFTMAKQGMDKLMSEINTILTYSIQGDDPMTCPTEQQHSCSGSCGTCGGCG